MVPDPPAFPSLDFPSVTLALEDGINRRLQTGVQIYVSHQETTILDAALGDASPGFPLTSAAIMPWRSAGKPLTALLVLRQMELGRLQLTSSLEELLPETYGTDIALVTVFDLLTHQSGFPQTDTGWPHADWPESLIRITREPRQLEIGTAAYHPQSSWFLLGEILRQLEPIQPADSFNTILQRDLLDPLAMFGTMCGVSLQRFNEDPELLPVLYEREQGQLRRSSWMDEPWLSRSSPGGNLRGPIRELGRFLEMLMRRGKLADGTPFVSASTVDQMTARQRSGAYDQTLQHVVDFGLGVICDSKRYGLETVPYGFGRYCSEATFGHGGSQCSMGFCDPEHSLVVAWSANGFCGEGQHQRRNRLINEAVYRDLGLAD
jgi:CubicO group peptidase (beta-lactamase class C family)